MIIQITDEDIATGKVCDSCEHPMQGESTHPRSCMKCAHEWVADQLQVKIEKASFKIRERAQIDYAIQLRISTGSVVNIYQNKKGRIKILLQGIQNKHLLKLINQYIQSNIKTQ